ncbi:MAG: hypothetical protein SGARI_007433 [Bacillariaceae sp.]
MHIQKIKKSQAQDEHESEPDAVESETQSHTEHSDEEFKDEDGDSNKKRPHADKLQMEVDKAERKNRSLQSTLESLQEKMEQYITARDPLGGGAQNTDPNDSDRLITRPKKILASRPEVLFE